MTTSSSLCIRLQSKVDSSVSNGQDITAKSPQELENARKEIESASLDELTFVVQASDLGSLYNPMEIAHWIPLLKVNASVSVMVTGEAVDLQTVHTSFLLAGLSSASERREANGSRVLTGTYKNTVVVSAAPLKKKDSTAVTISLDDDDDMIDEDNLLSDDILAPPPAMSEQTSTDDCAGRKPCDNCTCGRADGMEVDESMAAPSSSCGKCHMGDAFRCASCPYLGKPAFKAGEEHLVLDLSDDL